MVEIIEYRNKSSVLKTHTRYVQGGETEIKKKKLGWWERKIIDKNDVTDVTITITNDAAGRPDLIAYSVYKDAKLAWLILQYNNIVDVVEELAAGKEITLPNPQRVYFEILTSSPRYQEGR